MNWDGFLTAPGVERLGWTLLHFLWQGAAIALALAVLLRSARPASARVRYALALAALASMLAAPLATFGLVRPMAARPAMQAKVRQTANQVAQLFEMLAPSPSVARSEGGITREQPGVAGASGGVAEGHAPLAIRVRLWLPWLVLGWMLGVVALSARQLTVWGMVQRLRRRWVRPVEPRWEAALRRLALRLGVSRPVRLLESAVIEVPSLIGWAAPVILLPASMLTGLTPSQIEAILAHELAHVRRHDYLVNLIQSVVETLLFYHPAVWWVGRRVRQEREHCCDDLVVETMGDARGYALALTRMEELRTESSEYAMALTGGSLMKRIRRLMGLRDEETGGGRWLAGVIAACVLLVALAAMLTTGTPKATAQAETKGDAAAKVTPAVEKMPGFVAFDAAKIVGGQQAATEVTLNQTLLMLVTSAAREAQPDLTKTINALNLSLLQVRVYENLGADGAKAAENAQALVQKLVGSGWMPVVRVPEESVSILMRAEGNRIQGFLLLVAQDNELVFGNLVCDTDADQLGSNIGGLLNKAMAGQLDLSDLDLSGLGIKLGGGNAQRSTGGGPSVAMAITPDGFKTSLEVEKLELIDAEAVDAAGAGDGKAVKVNSADSAATGQIQLDPGFYQATLVMQAPDSDHDAVTLSVNGGPAQRVYRAGQDLGPVNQPVAFEIKAPTAVKVELKASESGMLLDRIDFARFKKKETATSSVTTGSATARVTVEAP